MVIEQTIDIPVDRRVFFEFLAPGELPAGPARVELKVTPVHEERCEEAAKAEGQAANPDTPPANVCADIAAQLGHIDIEQILEERRLKDAGLFTGKSTTPITDRLVGCLAHLGDITLEQIREERLNKKVEGQTGKSTTPHADFLSGILAGAGDITLEQIREERRRKYMV